MPNIKEHLLFDVILKWEGIISDKTKTEKVHNFIDERIPRHHYDLDDDLTEVMVRSWTDKRSGDQVTLTDYIRVAFGHLVIDETWDKNKPLIFNLRKALLLLKRRRFNKKKYICSKYRAEIN